jgi:translation initiation factor 5B
LYVVPPEETPAKYAKIVSDEIQKIRILTQVDGIILKTDTLGSLEAIAEILKQYDVKIRIADVGDVSKRDVVEASVVKTNEPLSGAVLAFGVKILPDAEQEAAADCVPIFKEPIIYNLIDKYLEWVKAKREAKVEMELEKLIKPGKILVMSGYIFRRAKPAIFGIEVLAGSLRPKYSLVRSEDGQDVGEVQQLQDKGKPISEARKGMQIALSMEKPTVGRHIFEKDILFVRVPEADAKILMSTYMDKLTEDDQEALKEYVAVMRKKTTPFWGAF